MGPWDGHLIGGELPTEQHKEDEEAKKIMRHLWSSRRDCVMQGRPEESVGLTKNQLLTLQRFFGIPEQSRTVAGIPLHLIAEREEPV